MPSINFAIDETTSANAQAAATALRSLTQEYQKLNRVLVKTEKQLLKFDEINRLVAYADKPVSAGRASSGRSSSSKSTSKSTTKKPETTPKTGTTAGGGGHRPARGPEQRKPPEYGRPCQCDCERPLSAERNRDRQQLRARHPGVFGWKTAV